jgi:hypothetical protein
LQRTTRYDRLKESLICGGGERVYRDAGFTLPVKALPH